MTEEEKGAEARRQESAEGERVCAELKLQLERAHAVVRKARRQLQPAAEKRTFKTEG